MTLAELELLGQLLRRLAPRQVEVPDANPFPLELVDRAVERLHVLGLEVVVDEHEHVQNPWPASEVHTSTIIARRVFSLT